MLKQNIQIAMLCFALAHLTGCGSKGPLYIPEQRYPQKATAPEVRKDIPEAHAPANAF